MHHSFLARVASISLAASITGVLCLVAIDLRFNFTPTHIENNSVYFDAVRPPPPPEEVVAEPPPRPTPLALAQGPVATLLTPTEADLENLPVLALPLDDGLPTIRQPQWRERPRDLARYYPQRALARGAEGWVVLDCIVGVTGALNCAVVSEAPEGWGFGEAALRIARDHNMVPAERDGVPIEGRYQMRVPFTLD